jgi:hypothetical protein
MKAITEVPAFLFYEFCDLLDTASLGEDSVWLLALDHQGYSTPASGSDVKNIR